METKFGLLDGILKAGASGVAFQFTQLARQVELRGRSEWMKQQSQEEKPFSFAVPFLFLCLGSKTL